MARKKYGVVESGKFYYFQASSDVYDGLATDLGWVDEAGAANALPIKMDETDPRRVRLAVTLAATAPVGGGAARAGSGRCYCHIDKATDALKNLTGKTYNGRGITSVRVPRTINYA